MKRKTRRLKSIGHESLALLQYLIEESYASGKDLHYRLKIPYTQKGQPEVEFIVEFSVYYDKALTTESENGTKREFKITGPDKDRQ
jgi:hypothetical protein